MWIHHRAAPCASRLAVAVAAAVLPSIAIAAPPSTSTVEATDLDRIEVHGRKSPTAESIERARARLSQRAGGTAVIDARRYRDGRVSTLTDALGFAPGVFVQSRFGAEEARLSIRGSGLQRTFHGRGLELLQDGSPLNLADGGFDMQAVEPLSTRHIEVFRGANALEYGAATLGGAINFVAPTGLDAPRVQLRAEGGRFGYARGQVAVGVQSERSDGYASVTGFAQDGFREHARQETYRLFANAGHRFGNTLDGRVYLTHVDTRSELPGNLTLAQATRRPEAAAPGNLALDQRRDFRLDRLAGKLAWTPRDADTVVVSAYVADKALDHPIFQVLRQDSRDAGIDVHWTHAGTLAGHRTAWTAGVAYARGDTEDDRFANMRGQAGARTNRFDQRATNAKAYAEHLTWVAPEWVVSVGAQALRSTRRSRDQFITAGRNESYRAEYDGISPKLGLRWDAAPGVQAFGNVSRSLEPPSFGELSGGPNVTQVDRQRATTAEIGMRIDRERLSLDAAFYRARIDGELLSLTDGAGNPLGTVNADRTVHQGLELGLEWRPSEAWRVSANYLWNDFRFDDDAVYGDNDLAGVPPHQLRASVRWSPSRRFHIAPSAEWVRDDYFIDHANTLRAPGYAIWGLRIGGAIGGGASWFVDGRNLGDRRWIASTNVVANARGRDAANFLPGDGRAVYAGIEWALR